jgi:hypothetical protein
VAEETLCNLYLRLRQDRDRASCPFTEDMTSITALMHHPYASPDEIAEGLLEWCAKRQPCQFGRLAASRRQIHVCFLRELDFADGDDGIAARIAEGKRLWKQRAATDRRNPPHALLLVFASPRLALAVPDDNLRRFADRLLSLAGWSPERRQRLGDNTVSSDFLYLPHPDEGTFYGYQFNVDFFAAAGDGRWWHDHRIPGGIAFTANSTGHMRYFRDWYKQPGTDHGQWAIKQAMLTIANAHPYAPSAGSNPADPSGEGRVTWLRDLGPAGTPFVPGIPCPLSDVPKTLQGKDWTRYEGLLHTDHAVREEFFEDRALPPTVHRPYLMDFTYLYNRREADFVKFTEGVQVSADQVYAEIGRPEDWLHRSSHTLIGDDIVESAADVAELLCQCRMMPIDERYLPVDD